MKKLSESFQILTDISDGGIRELLHLERIARVCYKSEENISMDGESAKKLIRNLIKNGHHAMLEHGYLSVLLTVDRGVSHELVRHRVASFAQESTRYCNYTGDKFGGEITVIDPSYAFDLDINEGNYERYLEWEAAIKDAERHYTRIIELGGTAQEARAVLPHSTKVDIVMSANYREWRHIFNLRALGTTGKPHPQMVEVMLPLLKEVQSRIPVIFDDLVIE